MANLHAAAAAAAQAQAAHQAVASSKAVQAAAVAAAAAASVAPSGAEPTNHVLSSTPHPSSSANNPTATGQFLAAPSPLVPLHPSAHHLHASHHPHHVYFSSTSTQPTPNGCTTTGTVVPPTTQATGSQPVTALSPIL